LQVFQDGKLCYKLAGAGDAGLQITVKDPSLDMPKGGLSVASSPVTDGGYTRSYEVTIKCDPSATSSPTMGWGSEEKPTADSSIYHFTMSSYAACAGAKPTPSGRHCGVFGCFLGYSGFFMILIGVAIVLYFVIGTIIGKFVQKKEGLEIIPQFALWKDIPFLLKDGAMFFVDLFRSVTNKGGYQEVSA
jgi:hypothetical protein